MREGPPAFARQARTRVASFPPVLGANPYQRLLYEQLARHGIELADDARLKLRWLWAARHDVRFLHFHWAAGFYRFGHGPRMLRRPLSWLDPGVFGTLGVGGGFALAAKLARPSAEVWLIYGDGCPYVAHP